eukprot:1140066-Pelagomonas_calceolata.AAC.3
MDWRPFSVMLKESQIPEINTVIEAISLEQRKKMQEYGAKDAASYLFISRLYEVCCSSHDVCATHDDMQAQCPAEKHDGPGSWPQIKPLAEDGSKIYALYSTFLVHHPRAGRYDAFETTLEILRMRADYPGTPPEEYAKKRLGHPDKPPTEYVMVDQSFKRFMACGADEIGQGKFSPTHPVQDGCLDAVEPSPMHHGGEHKMCVTLIVFAQTASCCT